MSFFSSLFGRGKKQATTARKIERSIEPRLQSIPSDTDKENREDVGAAETMKKVQAEIAKPDPKPEAERKPEPEPKPVLTEPAVSEKEAVTEPKGSQNLEGDPGPKSQSRGTVPPAAFKQTGRKAGKPAPRRDPALPPMRRARTDAKPNAEDGSTSAILRDVAEKLKQPTKPGIWDVEEGHVDGASDVDRSGLSDAASPAGALQRAPGRKRRNKTRLIGFDTSEGDAVNLFGGEGASDADAAPAAPVSVLFPVGWLLLIEGPGRGHAFPLVPGVSAIGRGADQSVRLDFGDNAISRSNHAAVAYDPDERTFLLGQGGKSNIVRLNGKPVISNEDLSDGDTIKIGETVLKLKTLCGPDFDWSDTDDGEEEDDDVAIA